MRLLTDRSAGRVARPRATLSTSIVRRVPRRRHSSVCQRSSATPTLLIAAWISGRRSSTSTQLGRPASPSICSLYWLPRTE
jgi:hypothetical protein